MQGNLVHIINYYEERISILEGRLKVFLDEEERIKKERIKKERIEYLYDYIVSFPFRELFHDIINNYSNYPNLLDLNYCEINSDDISALIEALMINNIHFTKFNLDGNEIENEGAIALAEFLKINPLTELYLDNNEIGNEGAIAIAEALKVNTSLKILDLDNNEIGNEGAIELCEMLKVNTSLTTLNLNNNQIGDEVVIAIAEALKYNNSLIDLLYDENSIWK